LDPVSQQLTELKNKFSESFATMWTEDAELRNVALLASRTIGELEGPAALGFAATHVGQMLAAMWKGVQPMLAHYASLCISRLIDSQVASARLPPPRLEEKDEDLSQTTVFHLIAGSYVEASQETLELVAALPRSVRVSIVKVQAAFRGFLFRSRYFGRTRDVSLYCNVKRWPRLAPVMDAEEDNEPKDLKKRKKAKPVKPRSRPRRRRRPPAPAPPRRTGATRRAPRTGAGRRPRPRGSRGARRA